MSERSHQENLYVLLRNAKGGQQAKKMHGATDPLTPDHSKEGIRTEDATAVQYRLSGRTGSGGLGTPQTGDEVRVRYASQLFPRTNGPREKLRRINAQD